MSTSFDEPRLPSYNEALEWGVAPSPRPQWAPPRSPSPPTTTRTSGSSPRSPRPRTASRVPLMGHVSMSAIDDAIASARASYNQNHNRPHTPNTRRNQSSPPSARPQRERATRLASYENPMTSIDEALARPQRADFLRNRQIQDPRSLLNIGLNAVLVDALNAGAAATAAAAAAAAGTTTTPTPITHPATSSGIPRAPGTSSNSNSTSSSGCPTRASSTRTTRSAANVPARPSTSQGFTPAFGDGRPATPNAEELGDAPAYTLAPAPLPQSIRPIVPPTYTRHDPIARTYLLRSPLVYSSTGSSPQNAAFQLDARPSKASGRPFQLAIRPLDHFESRTLSLRSHRRESLDYDDDHTLYLLQVMQLIGGGFGLGFGPSWRIEMQRDPNGNGGDNKGFIRFEGGGILGTGKGFMQRSACKFYYMTKRTEVHLRTASEWKLIQKYGWQPEFEWNKRLMFSVAKKRHAVGKARGYEWKDGKGRLLAIESAEGRLDLSGLATGMSAQSREALLACWIGKAWAAGQLGLNLKQRERD